MEYENEEEVDYINIIYDSIYFTAEECGFEVKNEDINLKDGYVSFYIERKEEYPLFVKIKYIKSNTWSCVFEAKIGYYTKEFMLNDDYPFAYCVEKVIEYIKEKGLDYF
jgi:hypothetical protein